MTEQSSSTASESAMSRIMKLLNLANDEGAQPAERKLAEEHAERLMAQHMVDRFEAEQKAKGNYHQKRKPIQETWEIVMSAYKSKTSDTSGNEFDYQVVDMMKYVLQHCGVRVNPNFTYAKKVMHAGTEQEYQGTDYSKRAYQIVGFAEDIAYAERIWFNVFRTFVSNVNPQWDISQPLEYNAYNFASAGVSWKQQVLLAEAAGDTRIEWPWRYQGEDRSQPFYSSFQANALIDPGNKPWGQSIHKLKRACKKYSDSNNVPYPYAGGTKLRVATRNSFARSYRQTIKERLNEIRKLAQTGEDHVDSNKFAVAIKDTKERVDEEFERLFPEFSEEARRKQQEAYEFERAVLWAALTPAEQAKVLREEAREEQRYQRRRAASRRNFGAIREDSAQKYDHAAWERGRSAAQTVNLRADAEVKKETRKEIG